MPDIERTDLLVVMGANPAASQGSLLAAPDVMGLIEAVRRRGAVIVIDPVRTRTAERADEWLPISPGSDAALLLAVVHTLFAEDLVTLGALVPHLDAVETVRSLVADWPPAPPEPGPRPTIPHTVTFLLSFGHVVVGHNRAPPVPMRRPIARTHHAVADRRAELASGFR